MQVKRNIAVIAVAAMMGLGVAACGSTSGGVAPTSPQNAGNPTGLNPPQPPVTPTTTAPAPTTTVAPAPGDHPDTTGYINALSVGGGHGYGISAVPESTLVSLGQTVCTDLEKGNITVNQEDLSLVGQFGPFTTSSDRPASGPLSNAPSFTLTDLGNVIVAAGTYLCQSQNAATQAWLAANPPTNDIAPPANVPIAGGG